MRRLHEQSLGLFFLLVFVAALVGQSFAGQHAYNEEAAQHGEEAISWARYVVSSEFGAAVVENWQSEFLAVGAMTVFAIYLRQRGSPESKPVGAPHDATGETG